MSVLVEGAAAFAVRLGLVVLFLPFSALDKIINFNAATDQASSVLRPRVVAKASILLGLAIEIFMPLGVLSGIADRIAALVLAGYCLATAVLFKPFWRLGDFWAAGESKSRDVFWDFLKNLSLGAGFLVITVGPNGQGLRPFLSHPLASSHPYASSGARYEH